MCTCDRRIGLDIVCGDRAYAPAYATPNDFCMDVKARIDGKITIPAQECVTVGTGIQVKIPVGYGMIIAPRSSTGFKLHCELENTFGVIDAGYRDEIKLCVRNKGKEDVVIEDKQRICQLMIIPKYEVMLNFVEDNEAFRKDDRGGGIGSTGKGIE